LVESGSCSILENEVITHSGGSYMSQRTDQASLASRLEDYSLAEEDLTQVTGGTVTDTQGALIGSLVGAKVLGVHSAIAGYKHGAKSAIPLLEAGGPKGSKGALAAGTIGAVEGAVGGGLAGGIGVHEVNALSGHK
jgi:hypothetical protein